ncbi:hypothetical protein EJ08DRAFT_693183 [Tothia fuscella]|uniref:Uncharacterized protein n=1 Tax=Tothia fuscella TaxID=1048955 RepID=A0A9P4NYB6_9PEZI|nr:hypothetical protein EJ08DRAFT_693183 [Tothia fuscella]
MEKLRKASAISNANTFTPQMYDPGVSNPRRFSEAVSPKHLPPARSLPTTVSSIHQLQPSFRMLREELELLLDNLPSSQTPDLVRRAALRAHGEIDRWGHNIFECSAFEKYDIQEVDPTVLGETQSTLSDMRNAVDELRAFMPPPPTEGMDLLQPIWRFVDGVLERLNGFLESRSRIPLGEVRESKESELMNAVEQKYLRMRPAAEDLAKATRALTRLQYRCRLAVVKVSANKAEERAELEALEDDRLGENLGWGGH